MKTHSFGYKPDLMDQRDHVYSFPRIATLPQTVNLSSGFPPAYDQGAIGSCVAQSICALYEYQRKKQGHVFMSPSRLFAYYNARLLDGSEAYDAGATIRNGIKAVADYGVPAENVWPYVQNRFAVKPHRVAYSVALRNQALSYKRIMPDLNSMLYSLAQGVPFAFGFAVYASLETPEVQRTGRVPMPKEDESVIGGHAVVACGYNQRTRMFLVRNS